MLRPWQIPTIVTRPWRLVRELDGYSDEECRRFMESIARVRFTALAGAFPIAIVLGISLAMCGMFVVDAAGRDHWAFDTRAVWGRMIASVLWLLVLAISATGAFLPYALAMRWALLRKLNRLVCPACDYSLLGLPISAGSIRCSECGELVALAEHGWTEADIIEGKRQDRAGERGRQRWPLWWIPALMIGLPYAGWVATGMENLLIAAIFALNVLPFYVLIVRDRL